MTDKALDKQITNAQNETAEIIRKQKELLKYKVDSDYDQMVESNRFLSENNQIDFSRMSLKKVQEAQVETTEYLQQARNAKTFLANTDFQGVVPFFAKNLIMIGGRSGHGKSTISGNVNYHTLSQGGMVCYITNEETVGDSYNRVTCLKKGWAYVDHDQFTQQQLDIFNRAMPILAKRMTVIDDINDQGHGGQTTTYEGIVNVLESLLRSPIKYDLIVLDYYQNITKSIENPRLNPWEVQEKLAFYLDQYRKRYLAPIVILAQLKEGKDLTFKEALEGRKLLYNKATCVLEIKADPANSRTEWKVHKSRFNKSIGNSIYTGFDRGEYVKYTLDFKNKAELSKQRKQQEDILKNLNVKGNMKDEEN